MNMKRIARSSSVALVLAGASWAVAQQLPRNEIPELLDAPLGVSVDSHLDGWQARVTRPISSSANGSGACCSSDKTAKYAHLWQDYCNEPNCATGLEQSGGANCEFDACSSSTGLRYSWNPLNWLAHGTLGVQNRSVCAKGHLLPSQQFACSEQYTVAEVPAPESSRIPVPVETEIRNNELTARSRENRVRIQSQDSISIAVVEHLPSQAPAVTVVIAEPVVSELVITGPLITEPLITEPLITEPLVTGPPSADPSEPFSQEVTTVTDLSDDLLIGGSRLNNMPEESRSYLPYDADPTVANPRQNELPAQYSPIGPPSPNNGFEGGQLAPDALASGDLDSNALEMEDASRWESPTPIIESDRLDADSRTPRHTQSLLPLPDTIADVLESSNRNLQTPYSSGLNIIRFRSLADPNQQVVRSKESLAAKQVARPSFTQRQAAKPKAINVIPDAPLPSFDMRMSISNAPKEQATFRKVSGIKNDSTSSLPQRANQKMARNPAS